MIQFGIMHTATSERHRPSDPYIHAEEELEVVVSTSSETPARIRHGEIRDRDWAGGVIIYDL